VSGSIERLKRKWFCLVEKFRVFQQNRPEAVARNNQVMTLISFSIYTWSNPYYSALCFVILQAFRFAPAHHTPALQAAMHLGDHGVLSFAVMVIIKVNHDPVCSAPELMCTRRIGVERGEMPVIMSRV
jgi:hypothetical protein